MRQFFRCEIMRIRRQLLKFRALSFEREALLWGPGATMGTNKGRISFRVSLLG